MQLKSMLPYLLVNFISFYILPFLIKDTSSAMTIMLIGIPLITLVTALCYGLKYNVNLNYALIVGLLFTPTIFIFYNYTAWFYSLAYALIVVVGNLIGNLLKQAKFL